LRRAAGAAGIAAIGHHADAPALGHEAPDALGAVGEPPGVAVEIKQRRLARPRLAVPGDDALAVGRGERALGDAGEPYLGGRYARAIREVHEPALAEIGREQNGGVGDEREDRELDEERHRGPSRAA